MTPIFPIANLLCDMPIIGLPFMAMPRQTVTSAGFFPASFIGTLTATGIAVFATAAKAGSATNTTPAVANALCPPLNCPHCLPRFSPNIPDAPVEATPIIPLGIKGIAHIASCAPPTAYSSPLISSLVTSGKACRVGEKKRVDTP